MGDRKLQLDANASLEFGILMRNQFPSSQCNLQYGNGIDGLGYPPSNPAGGFSGFSSLINSFRRRCPLCDSSVYNYCSDKLFHDSCCCHDPNNPYDRLPFQCQYADCSFLHANSCQEHKLITACCCLSQVYKK
ncbi:hypothetical protein NQ317_001860 [Molorchus minor]|uniref:Uncharacterized protein n=1 Tax=Molorchus minor TaxID=1323400 RepID=A0ABQ9JXN0_9CUCU|nr:hypothetical protein NQ317_001860 [Molorchus minor]